MGSNDFWYSVPKLWKEIGESALSDGEHCLANSSSAKKAMSVCTPLSTSNDEKEQPGSTMREKSIVVLGGVSNVPLSINSA